MFNIQKIAPLFLFISFVFPHAAGNVNLSTNIDCILTGAEHMITGYDHILFLIGVVFFLKHYSDIIKFITAFTIGHCITLVFATKTGIKIEPSLIDAVIAFSVIYKGFENLGGFKKYFSINPPNLIVMVFIFGLIHGLGLSTSLQEMAEKEHELLDLYKILTFNVGVEFGQIVWLLIVFPLLSIFRLGKHFNLISRISNWSLIAAGIFLLNFQLHNYYHHHDNVLEGPQESELEVNSEDNHLIPELEAAPIDNHHEHEEHHHGGSHHKH